MKNAFIISCRPNYVHLRGYIDIEKPNMKEFFIIDTGQHYDTNLSKSFLKELSLPEPKYHLEIKNEDGSNAFIERLLPVIEKEMPETAFVIGDTNGAMYSALALKLAGVKLTHIEAGLRCGNTGMPEERNRIAIDHICDVLLCPTKYAEANLENENVMGEIRTSPNYKLETMKKYIKKTDTFDSIGPYNLLTIHRQENADNKNNLMNILEAVSHSKIRTVFPCHPRTRNNLTFSIPDEIEITEPVGYVDFLELMNNASVIITDSGGCQLEAYELGKKVVVLRNETEWMHTLGERVVLVGNDYARIKGALI